MPEGAAARRADVDIKGVTRGWRAMRFAGALAFDEVGILAGITRTLAEAGVSVFAVSTYATDYVLVREAEWDAAARALAAAGYEVKRLEARD